MHTLRDIQLSINSYNWLLEDAMEKLDEKSYETGTSVSNKIEESEEFEDLLASIQNYTEFLREIEKSL